ncbi:MAG: hypothetical protein D084_Lepto4C00347G0006 [Leptospirillum sp. Group IV 'UBA BS']|nr:MAG: hypothetical protein D084_Lepto4C00347G0006 [Leptospirillum sp. Group IV 'UBA BS']
MVHASDTKIVRHVKVKAQAHPFDPKWTEYFNAKKLVLRLKSKWDSLFGPANARESKLE